MIYGSRIAGALIVMALLAGPAFAWGPATHAYIASQLWDKCEWKDSDKVYAAMVPDMFETQFKAPYLPHLANLSYAMHWKYLQVWDAANAHRAPAYGFVSHNAHWGADSFAHNYDGYIVVKTAALKQALLSMPEFQALGLSDAATDNISHVLLEYGVDALVKSLDPQIGQTIIDAAMSREPALMPLLIRAYGAEFAEYFGGAQQAENAIWTAENEFRVRVLLYGYALNQSPTVAVQLMAQEGAQLAPHYLALTGDTLPPGVTLQPLIQAGIAKAMEICAGDFAAHVQSTATEVKVRLKEAGMRY